VTLCALVSPGAIRVCFRQISAHTQISKNSLPPVHTYIYIIYIHIYKSKMTYIYILRCDFFFTPTLCTLLQIVHISSGYPRILRRLVFLSLQSICIFIYIYILTLIFCQRDIVRVGTLRGFYQLIPTHTQ